MREQLITVETAKLAKEAGFREVTLSYYNCNKDGVYGTEAFNQIDYKEQEPVVIPHRKKGELDESNQ